MELSSDISSEIKQRIEQAILNSIVEVSSAGNRHYSISVSSTAFEDLTQVKQHQMVYAAIKDLMAGDLAPIHAIDQLNIQSN